MLTPPSPCSIAFRLHLTEPRSSWRLWPSFQKLHQTAQRASGCSKSANFQVVKLLTGDCAEAVLRLHGAAQVWLHNRQLNNG